MKSYAILYLNDISFNVSNHVVHSEYTNFEIAENSNDSFAKDYTWYGFHYAHVKILQENSKSDTFWSTSMTLRREFFLGNMLNG
jgi:hypothetical protein